MNQETKHILARTRGENAEHVISSLKALGLKPHPSCRLMKMCRVLTEPLEVVSPDDPGFETALEAERDFQILGFVFDQVNEDSDDPEFLRLVRNTLKDSILPQDDREGSKGRDAQFELLVAAICQSAGMLPVSREEPDVICHIEDTKYGIAAKRIKNVAKLEQNVRKAAKQIQGVGVRGFIALDTSVALNRENERITTPIPDKQFGLLYRDALNEFIHQYHDRIQQWVRGKGVRGILFHDHQVRFCEDGVWSLVGMTMKLNTARHNQCRNREFHAFASRYEKGLPNLQEF